MLQMDISLWCRPCGPKPGRDGAGPPASRRSTQATGGSAYLGPRGKQSKVTGHSTLPTTAIRVAQWNAEGIQQKKTELQAFLRNQKIDVLCAQETHLSEGRRFFVRGYDIFRHDRSGHKGGVLTLVRHGIPAIEKERSSNGQLEFITISLMLQGEQLLITNCYSPPTARLDLHTIHLSQENHLIMGDFNGHSPSWGYSSFDNRGEMIEDWLIDNQLILINTPEDKASYYSRAWKTTSTPDLAMATEDIQKLTTRVVNDQLGGSDHVPITLHIADKKTDNEYQRKHASWNFKLADWQKFQQHAEELGNLNLSEDMNSNVKQLTESILSAARKSIPRGFRKDYKPFWSKSLDTLHKQLSEARATMERHPTAENTTRYNNVKNEFNKTKLQETRNSWKEKTASLSLEKDTGKLWKITKLLNEDATNKHKTTVLIENETPLMGKKAANLLAKGFEAESTLQVPPERRREVQAEMKEKLRRTYTHTPAMDSDLTIAELNDAIKRLKPKRSPGKDGVCNEMIKKLGPSAREKLLQLYNLSWKTGVFPSAWKEAIIVPIPKKGKNPTLKTSYRPVSLLSCLGKTLERMINKRLQWHLEENNLITKEQTAFRKNRNTEDQLVYLAQSIENSFQEKKKTVATFIDLSKAFDKVWKEGLLLKLLKSGVTGRMLNWTKSFLRHRSAKVKLGSNLSHTVKIREGVPQGSVISPTLFVVFINDISANLSRHISRALHADDFAMWNASESTQTAAVRMQDALDKTCQWAKDWCVTINNQKTVASLFSLSNTKENLKLKVNKQQIPQDDTPTYLGVKLDKKLTWNPHIQDIEKRASKRLCLLKKLAGTKWGANSSTLKTVYMGTVRPVMEYGSAAWATAAKSNTSRLAKLQNAGMRLITGGLKTTPINTLETTTGLQSLELRREEKTLTQSQKLHRLTEHPAHKLLSGPSRNRLKRGSFNQLAKKLEEENSDILPTSPEEQEPLHNGENWDPQLADIVFATDIPGVTGKADQSEPALRSLALELLDQNYNASVWTHSYTDEDEAIKNGGSGIFTRFPDGSTTSTHLPAGNLSTNYRAELTALKQAAMLISAQSAKPSHVVFLTDCKSAIQSLQSPKDQLERDALHSLTALSRQVKVAVQWIPAHCGLTGNEEADRLAKLGSRLEQPNPPVSYREAKTLIKQRFLNNWKDDHQVPLYDCMAHLQRAQQTTIFRLRTGHCRLLNHMYRLGLSHTPECPCQTGLQTPEHILQSCPMFHEARMQQWPSGATLSEKLWGNKNDLTKTTDFLTKTNLTI